MSADPQPCTTARRWYLAIGLGLLGLALNTLPVEIFSGIYLLFGHLAVAAAAVLLGPLGGAGAGAISGAITPLFWSHPWAWIFYTLEGLVVGAASRRHLPMVAAALYWFSAAVPYGLALGLVYPAGIATGIVVKTVVEGCLAALVVQVVVLAPRLHRLLYPLLPRPLADASLRSTVASVALLTALFPLLVLGVADARLVYYRRLAELDRANLAAAEAAGDAIGAAVERARSAVLDAATAGGLEQAGLSRLLLRDPLIREVALVDRGRVLAREVRSADGIGLLDDASRLPSEAGVFEVDLPGSGVPVLLVAAPLSDGGRVLIAALDPERLDRSLAARARDGARLFLLDETGRALAATDGATLDDRLRRAIASIGAEGTIAYLADPEALRSLRPQATVRVAATTADPFGWRVVSVRRQAALQPQIEAEALGMFGGFCAAVLVTVIAGLTLVRVVVSPIDDAARIARRLRRGDRRARVAGYLYDAPREIRLLGDGLNGLADEVERQLGLVERAGRAKDEFLSVASHELKTPLAILKAQIQLMQRRPPETHEKQLRTIARQLDRLNRLVSKLLDASSIGPGAIPLEPRELELSTVVCRVVDDLRPAVPDRELRLDLEEVRGRWDELRIEQVLHNLIGNALKFSPADQPVDVSVRARPDAAELQVADRGIGIRPEEVEGLFQRYARGSSPGEGLGVGLYVVRSIVNRHGGTVQLAPRDGGGTVATVVLPREVGEG